MMTLIVAFLITRTHLNSRVVPLQALKVCVEVDLYVHVFMVLLLAPTALIPMEEYPVHNE